MPDGSIVLMGGRDSGNNRKNDVWRSTNNGVSWTQMTANAGWSARMSHSSVAMPDGSIVLMGGDVNGVPINNLGDVWRSTDKGATWTQMTANAGWIARAEHNSVVLPDGSIVLMGGINNTGYYKNDVWRSTDNGATWTQMTANAEWRARSGHSSVAMPDGSIVLMGGYANDGNLKNDAWRSTDKGATWTQMTASAGWLARYWFSSVAMPDSSIVLIGGIAGSGPTSDVWRSTDNGATWTRVTASAGWIKRGVHTSVAVADGSIVLMGGYDFSRKNDTWRLVPTGSSVRNPSHTYTAPGIYPVALQAYNTGGYNSTRKTGYVTVTAATIAPVANFTGSPRSGTAPLNVQFNDTSTGTGITAYQWLFSDSATLYTTRNLTHSFTNPGVYNVNHSATNSSGPAVWKNVTAYITVSASPVAPVANFTGSPTSGTAPLNVQFNDTSTGTGITAYQWLFSDSATVFTMQNLTHSFTNPGVYNVNHSATNSSGPAVWKNVTAYITVSASPVAPVATFSTNKTSGIAPLSVQFNDTSTGSPTSWNWSFGDGTWFNTTVAAQRNTTHSFTAPGSFTTRLLVSNAVGQDITTPGTTITSTAPVLPPGADFSGTPTTGAASLNVQFTDLSTNTPTGWAWFFGDENWAVPVWTQMNASAGWSHRYDQSSVVMADGSIVLMGGTDEWGNYNNDVWRSEDKGATWTRQTVAANWTARQGHTSVVLPDDSIVLMGGSATDGEKNDVWRSEDKGATWTRQTGSAAWSARGYHSSVAMPDGSIVLIDGAAQSDVWRSTDKGKTWTKFPNAGWTPRIGHSSVVMPDGSIVLMGGLAGGVNMNDVWRSTDKGETWTIMTANAGWAARWMQSSVVMPDGSIVLTSGFTGTFKNDVWRSTDYGTTWTQLNTNAGWTPRADQSCVAMADGSIVLMGGYGAADMNDVWRFVPTGSSTQSPSHTYTTPGTYQVAMQAYNADGYNSTRKTGYITVTASPVSPVANFTGSPTSGTAPLNVQFNDTSTGTGITAYQWLFSDSGTVFTDRNLTHTFASAGIYNVHHSATNSSGPAVWKNVTGYITVTAPAPVANFAGTPTSGTAPLNVQFTDTSTGTGITAYRWLFSDSDTVYTTQNLTHTFTNPGIYNVHHSATNSSGPAVWKNVTGYITVTAPAPVANFAGTPTSGIAPLNVQFTDTSTGTPTGWTWFFGDENWTLHGWGPNLDPDADGRSTRYLHSSVVLPDGSIVLMGGTDEWGNYNNDVWRSTNDGATWTLQTASAEWPARERHSSVVMPDGSIVLMGGRNGLTMNDVWRSTDKGITWTQQTASAGWRERSGHSSVVMPDGSIILMGGEDWQYNGMNDVWRSTNNGASWTHVTYAEWAGRSSHSSVVMPDSSIVLMGGRNGNMHTNDVWRSTNNGASWTHVTYAEWAGRSSHSSVVMPDGSIVLMGGTNYISGLGTSYLNDVWRSTDNGTTWIQLENSWPNQIWSPREGHTSVAVTDGSIILMGGHDSSGKRDDVWRFVPTGSSAQSPSHIYTTPGTYQVTLQAYNIGGYNSMRKTGYVTVNQSSPPNSITNLVNSTYQPTYINWTWTDPGDSDFDHVMVYLDGIWRVNVTKGIRFYNATLLTSATEYTLGTKTVDTSGIVNTTWVNHTAETAPPTQLDIGEKWIQATDNAGWSIRHSPVSTVYDNKMWIVGGSGITNDVWSSPDGSTWTLVNASAAWSPRDGNRVVVFKDRMWLLGGAATGGNKNDVWYSTDGNTWTLANASAGWPGRYYHSVLVYDDKIWVFAGATGIGDGMKNDVWYSPDGFNWTEATANAAWSPRYVSGATVYDNKMWIMGGYNGGPHKDVWYSNDGVNWTEATSNAPWGQRWVFPVVSFDNSMWVLGGAHAVYGQTNDVWCSTDGGNWTLVNASVNWPPRQHLTSVVFNGKMWIFGGDARNDVWYTSGSIAPVAAFAACPVTGGVPLTVSFTDTSQNGPIAWNWTFGDGTYNITQNPVHTYTNIGSFSVSLNSTNTEGSNSTVKAGYITVSAAPVAPVASFTGSPRSGTAPLNVQFNDTSTGTDITGYQWIFSDSATVYTTQNLTHTFTDTGTYNVNHSVTNSTGTTWKNETGYITVNLPGSNNITVLPTLSTLTAGQVLKYSLVLDSAPKGLSGYNITIALTNSAVAGIIGVEFPAWAQLPENSTLPADSAWCKVIDLTGASGTENIYLVNVTVRADAAGTTNLTVIPTSVDDRDAGRYSPGIRDAAITVSVVVLPFPKPSGGFFPPPTDPNHDGLFEDLDGNGWIGFNDVVVYYNNMYNIDTGLYGPIAVYDYDHSGFIGFNDVVRLYGMIE